MQIFRVENTGQDGRLAPRLPRLAGRLLAIYGALTLITAIALKLAGMTVLQAVCHAMSALSTGGFSTSDRSLAAFGDAARWICTIAMILGGANLALFISRWRGKRWRIVKDTQIRWYLLTALVFSALLAFWRWAVQSLPAVRAVEESVFQAVSILTTSGFRLGEEHGWNGFASVAVFVLCFIGGCTGSAAGGIKIFRYEVLFAISRLHIARMLHPHGVFFVTFNRLRLPEAVLRSVLGFFMLYFCCFAVLAVGLAIVGLDPLSSLAASAAAIGNIGPAGGPALGVVGGYLALPAAAKILLIMGMLVGRLELAPVLVLALPSFWRD